MAVGEKGLGSQGFDSGLCRSNGADCTKGSKCLKFRVLKDSDVMGFPKSWSVELAPWWQLITGLRGLF